MRSVAATSREPLAAGGAAAAGTADRVGGGMMSGPKGVSALARERCGEAALKFLLASAPAEGGGSNAAADAAAGIRIAAASQLLDV